MPRCLLDQPKMTRIGARALGLGLLLMLALLPAACTRSGDAGDEAAAAGTLVVLLEAAPKTLDPLLATDAYGVRISHHLLFDTLLRQNEQLRIVPGLAESWKRPEPTRYRLTLKAGVRFHDGSPLTADDVVYTLTSLMDPSLGSPYGAGLRDKISGVRADGPDTVVVELNAPYAAFLDDLVVPVRSRDAGREHPLRGSGPYRLVRQSPGEIELARVPDYHGGAAGVPRLLFKVVKDANTRLLKLRKGNVDLAINALPLDKISQFREGELAGQYRLVEAPGLSYQYLGFNTADPILSDVRVRRALAHAIDIDGLIAHRQFGHSVRAVSLLPPDSPFAIKGLAPIAHDPARARALLDEAGYPPGEDGSRFTLTYKTTTDHAAVLQARAIQHDLEQVGVTVNVRSFEWGTFYDDIQKGNVQLFSLRWIGVSDPDFYYELFHSSRMPPAGRNRVRYSTPALDRLLERGRLAVDEVQRREIYRQVQVLVAEALPYLSLWHNNNIAIVSRRVQGFRLHPSGGFEYLPQVRLTAAPR